MADDRNNGTGGDRLMVAGQTKYGGDMQGLQKHFEYRFAGILAAIGLVPFLAMSCAGNQFKERKNGGSGADDTSTADGSGASIAVSSDCSLVNANDNARGSAPNVINGVNLGENTNCKPGDNEPTLAYLVAKLKCTVAPEAGLYQFDCSYGQYVAGKFVAAKKMPPEGNVSLTYQAPEAQVIRDGQLGYEPLSKAATCTPKDEGLKLSCTIPFSGQITAEGVALRVQSDIAVAGVKAKTIEGKAGYKSFTFEEPVTMDQAVNRQLSCAYNNGRYNLIPQYRSIALTRNKQGDLLLSYIRQFRADRFVGDNKLLTYGEAVTRKYAKGGNAWGEETLHYSGENWLKSQGLCNGGDARDHFNPEALHAVLDDQGNSTITIVGTPDLGYSGFRNPSDVWTRSYAAATGSWGKFQKLGIFTVQAYSTNKMLFQVNGKGEGMLLIPSSGPEYTAFPLADGVFQVGYRLRGPSVGSGPEFQPVKFPALLPLEDGKVIVAAATQGKYTDSFGNTEAMRLEYRVWKFDHGGTDDLLRWTGPTTILPETLMLEAQVAPRLFAANDHEFTAVFPRQGDNNIYDGTLIYRGNSTIGFDTTTRTYLDPSVGARVFYGYGQGTIVGDKSYTDSLFVYGDSSDAITTQTYRMDQSTPLFGITTPFNFAGESAIASLGRFGDLAALTNRVGDGVVMYCTSDGYYYLNSRVGLGRWSLPTRMEQWGNDGNIEIRSETGNGNDSMIQIPAHSLDDGGRFFAVTTKVSHPPIPISPQFVADEKLVLFEGNAPSAP